ncbi:MULTISPECIES: flagellin [unclassified Leisingera]|uniref:flagellin n=1 Tax=unclassified Leisingera TaxID=2614906 RepID=UPI0002D2C9B1|nr:MULTISPECIES: flagellin [unclassified Leisingera]KIC24342.1 flagellin [Leisingera sp. ANG-S3]KIC27866.1 flagellin [Leisingera sp. ANG-M6]KIC53058.1 flagellin [Leisingera sp. ANG-S]KID10042.1 flagellin [Leisingera sp. ANG1]
MISFHNNSGAMVALQTLGGVNSQLNQTQDSISTGQTINSAQDNAALWAISELMNSDISGLRSVSDSLSLGEATVAVASAGAEQITETLTEMRSLAIMASSGMGDFSKYEAAMAKKTEQINSIISSSGFNGVNLLKTDVDGAGGAGLTVPSAISSDGTLSTLSVDGVDFEGSPLFDLGGRTAITDSASALTALGEIEGFLAYAIEGSAALGSSANQLAGQGDYVSKQSDALTRGVSSMIDTNMEEAATKMLALQAQQQLSTLSLSIVNTMPDTLRNLY